MKTLIKRLAIVALIIFLGACKKLDLGPEDYYASGNFWKTSAQVDGAMVGLHKQMRDYQFTLFRLGELRGGTFKDATGATGTSSLNDVGPIRQDLRESNPFFTSWAGLYSPIFQVNNFIYQVEKSNFLADTDKKYYLGQAYGIRAFYYFHLFRTYGRVPLATEPGILTNTPKSASDAYISRSNTEKETLDFIKSDIDKSVSNFGANYTVKFQKAQWSLPATQMLKAEVYLWSAKVKLDGAAPSNTANDLTTARTAVEDAISKSAKVNNFADIFKYTNKGNNEIIFSLRYQIGEATSTFNQFVYAQTDPMSSFVSASNQPLSSDQPGSTPADPLKIAGSSSIIRYEYVFSLFEKYDATNDSRARSTFFDFYKAPITTNKYVNLRKYLGAMEGSDRRFADDFPIYRWGEAMLILAEIKNKQGQDPSAEINAIRQRAYGTNPYPMYTNGTFEQNELAIFEERGKELVAEGKRWYDLRRMQDASGDPLAFRKDLPLVGVLDKATQAYKLLWPIDKNVMGIDPTIVQNPGYPGT